MRVLHLINPASFGGGPCTLRLVAEAISRLRDDAHDVLIVGSATDVALARRCGLNPRGRISAALNQLAPGRHAVRRTIEEMERRQGPYDLVHAWTIGSTATTLVAGRRRVLCSAVVDPGSESVVELGRSGFPVLAASPAIAGALEAAGLSRDAVAVLPPAVDPERIVFEDRALLRQRWAADETAFVVALLGEPAEWQDGEFGVSVVGRAALTGKDIRIVLHHVQARRSASRRWLRRLGLEKILVVDDEVFEPWRIVAGLDTALVAPLPSRRREAGLGRRLASMLGARPPEVMGRPRPAAGAMAWAMAAGVPVVAGDTEAARELIDDEHTGLLYEPDDFNSAAARILDLFEDSRAASRIGAAAKAMIGHRFGPEQFGRRLAQAYRQCVGGEPIRIDDEPIAPKETQPSPRAHQASLMADG